MSADISSCHNCEDSLGLLWLEFRDAALTTDKEPA